MWCGLVGTVCLTAIAGICQQWWVYCDYIKQWIAFLYSRGLWSTAITACSMYKRGRWECDCLRSVQVPEMLSAVPHYCQTVWIGMKTCLTEFNCFRAVQSVMAAFSTYSNFTHTCSFFAFAHHDLPLYSTGYVRTVHSHSNHAALHRTAYLLLLHYKVAATVL